jgi:hypothetical protein
MQMEEHDPIPEFETLEDIAAFWDAHSTADYGDVTYEVQFEVKLRHPRRAEMKREEAAYVAMHAELWVKYPHEYVAVHQGKVVDHDPDVVALAKRVRRSLPGQIVLMTQVQPKAKRDLHFRSPRLVKDL